MWFKLAAANFSAKNLGKMADISNSYSINYNISGFTKTVAPPSVTKGETISEITLTLQENYEMNSTATLSYGSTSVNATVSGSTYKWTNITPTGSVTITAKATWVGTGEESGGSEGDGSGTVTYTITYKYQSGGVDIQTATTETVTAGTSMTFSTSNAPTITGYTVSKVSPTSATINSDTTVIYTYTAVASDSYGPNLLSTGELNEGYTLGSGSCTMTEKAEVYTYMYVPIEAGATYYGLNFKRCWWLDADKNALETYNGKNESPQWTATAPGNAAYWCGCAYYTEQELATASFAKILS